MVVNNKRSTKKRNNEAETPTPAGACPLANNESVIARLCAAIALRIQETVAEHLWTLTDPADIALSRKVLFSMDDVVELTSLSERYLQMCTSQGLLSPTRVGKRRLYSAAAVKAFMTTVTRRGEGSYNA